MQKRVKINQGGGISRMMIFERKWVFKKKRDAKEEEGKSPFRGNRVEIKNAFLEVHKIHPTTSSTVHYYEAASIIFCNTVAVRD